MKKFIIPIIGLLFCSQHLTAQNEFDALRYSNLEFYGDARFNAMGGSFGALGANMSSLSINPAGIGVYQSSDMSFTPAFHYNYTDTKLDGNSLTDGKLNFHFSNIGIVGNFSGSGDWQSVSFGMGYNRTSNFNTSISAKGKTDKTMLNTYVNELNANGGTFDGDIESLYPFSANLAYQNYLVNPTLADSLQYDNVFQNSKNITQTTNYETRGGSGEVFFTFGGNYNDKLYLGATMGIPTVRYIYDRNYTETSGANDTLTDFKSFTVNDYVKTTGAGVNFKLGMIYKVTDWVRIGMAFSLLQETFTITIAELIRQLITIPVGLFFLFYISSRLTLFIVAVIPIIAFIGVFFGKYIKKLSVTAQDDISESNKVVDETLHGIASVKAYANEFFELIRYKKSIDQSVETSIKRAKWRGLFIGVIMFVAGSALMAIVWYGLHMVQLNEADPTKGITIGELLQFALYASFIGVSFGGTAELFSQLQKSIGATESLMDILEENTEDVALTKPNEIKIEGNLSFKNVNFSYPSRRDIEVLKDVSFEVEKGKLLAFVGPSGAGKSTIASLIFGFYKPTAGEVLIDNKNLADYHLSEIRSQMALVPQEVMLFGGTIKENIEYGKPGASDDEIFDAAKQANALEFIEGFPEKFDTIVGDRGIQLSGGQKQRIAIARAILRNPSILVLDEATSALDSENERLVQEALERLMRGRTSIVIAHRLSTIKNADAIVVLDNGRIKEIGTHAELLKKDNGIYKNLSTIQLAAV
jgi:ABC-type multidrug transport system fused ATPase/permease subunit